MKATRTLSDLRKIALDAASDANRDLKNEFRRIKQRQAALKREALGMQLILMSLVERLGRIYSTAWFGTHGDLPKLHVSVWGADSFKDPRVLDALAFLTGAFEASDTHDYASSLNREYRFISDRFNVTLDVSVRSDSPTCRKVLVSEEVKTYTDPVYRIECD